MRRAPLPSPGLVPHALTIGIGDMGVMVDQRRFEPQAPRILCDEGGQLYEWSAERLMPLAAHHLPRAVAGQRDRGCRPLFPEPGFPLVVPWNEFRAVLESQIAHPERLRDGHRVAARAQIYEVTRAQSLAELAEAITGDRARASELTALTGRMVSVLGLTQYLPPPVRRPRPQSEAETIKVHERLVRLKLLADPTATMPARVDSPAPSTAALQADAPLAQPRAEKESIPQTFLKPWEFKKSREDVLYELTRRRGVVSTIRSWLAAIASRGERRIALRCWEMLRAGKTLEEQLWSVPPPRRAVSDSRVRDWAARTLAQAGYNLPMMLLEWEIFWRRKLD